MASFSPQPSCLERFPVVCHPLLVTIFVKCPMWRQGCTATSITKRSRYPVMPLAFDVRISYSWQHTSKASFPSVWQPLSLLSDKISVQFHLTLLPLKLPNLHSDPKTYSKPQLYFTFFSQKYVFSFTSFFIQNRKRGLNELNFAPGSPLLCFVLQFLSSVLWVHVPVVSNLGWTHFHTRN